MSTGGGQTPATTTTTSTPWSGAQPHLTNVMGRAQELHTGDVGYQPYTGPTQSGIQPWTDQSLNATAAMGQTDLYGSGGINAARSLAEQMQHNGGRLDIHDTAMGQLAGVGNSYGNMYQAASGNQNPYLLDQIAQSDRRIGDKVNSAMSGSGRYGSGAHTDVMARSLAEAANPILAQDYENRQNRMMGALQGQQGAWQGFSDIGSQGLGRAAAFAQMMPGLEQARYAGAERLGGVGGYLQERDQNDLNAQMQRFNLEQSRPWEQLARYSGIVGGMGGLGGTKITQAPNNSTTSLQRALGGGLAGAGIGSSFGPLGALAGGGLGALSGFL